MKSLKSKILIPVISIAIIGILFMSGALFSYAKKMLIHETEALVLSKNEKLVSSVEAIIGEAQGEMVLLSLQEVAQNFDMEKLKKIISSDQRDLTNI